MLANTSLTRQSSLSQYISYANSIPLLLESEEKNLLADFQNGNQEAGKKVAEAHLRIVIKTAFEFRYYCNNLWDMIAEGNIGLLKALKNFSLERGVRFVTYATLWVRASIQEFVLQSSSSVKINIGQMQKKIIFNLAKVKNSLLKYSQNSVSTKEISQALQVPESEVIAISCAMSSSENSLDESRHSEDLDNPLPKSAYISTQDPTPEETFFDSQKTKENSKKIQSVMLKLNDREKQIITKRFLTHSPSTLLQLSKEFKVSVERIRQIEAQALKKMRKCL